MVTKVAGSATDHPARSNAAVNWARVPKNTVPIGSMRVPSGLTEKTGSLATSACVTTGEALTCTVGGGASARWSTGSLSADHTITPATSSATATESPSAAWSMSIGRESGHIRPYRRHIRNAPIHRASNAMARSHPAKTSESQWTPRYTRDSPTIIAPAVALLVAGVIAWSALSDPVLQRALAPPPTVQVSASPVVTQAEVAKLPVFSVKPDGMRMEPIGTVFVGTRAQLTAAFERAGWSVAEPATFVTIARAFVDAALDLRYDTAPVTPTLLGGHTQDVAFERPQGRPTVRIRHHARWWQTAFTAGGEPVWVATMSFDDGITLTSDVLLPSHTIAPDIDAERDLVVRELLHTGVVAREPTVTVSPPARGTNAQGSAWFSGGQASVLVAR